MYAKIRLKKELTLHFEISIALRRVSKVPDVALVDARVSATEARNMKKQLPEESDSVIGD